MRSVALSPAAREQALQAMGDTELDVLVIGGGVVGAGAALDAATRGLSVGLVEARDFASGTSSRSSKLIHGGLRYLEMLDFRLVAEALAERGLLIETLAPHLVRPVPFLYPLKHRGWERLYAGSGRRALRHAVAAVGKVAGRAPPPPPHPQRRLAGDAVAAQGLAGGRPAVLRRPGRRRAAHDVHRPHGGGVRRAGRQPGAGHRASCARASGWPAPGARPGVRAELPHPRPAGGQRHRRLDRRHAVVGGRARPVPCPRQQGHPSRGAARPHPRRHRPHPAHREVGAVRHPVGPALDHRHHRHRLVAGQGPPGRVQPRTSTTCWST